MSSTLRLFLLGCLCLGGITPALLNAEPTPLTEKIPEENETIVRCRFEKRTANMPNFKNADLGKLTEGEYSYRLWIPRGYAAAPARRWPCVFVASPGGNAKMHGMADHLKASGYIVVMLVESKNGADGRCWENFMSAHDDVIQRLRVAEGFKFATGLSGGSRAASTFVQLRPGFAGLFQQGAGFLQDDKARYIQEGLPSRNFAIVTSIGARDDICFSEWPRLLRDAPKRIPFYPLVPDEGHSWSSKETAQQAFLILETALLEKQRCGGETAPIAADWLRQHAAAIPKITHPAHRIEAAERTLKAAARQGIAGDSTLATLKSQLADWKKDPAALKELKAEEAFQKLFIRSAVTGSKKQSVDFSGFAKRNEGTAAGKKAEAVAKGIEKFYR